MAGSCKVINISRVQSILCTQDEEEMFLSSWALLSQAHRMPGHWDAHWGQPWSCATQPPTTVLPHRAPCPPLSDEASHSLPVPLGFAKTAVWHPGEWKGSCGPRVLFPPSLGLSPITWVPQPCTLLMSLCWSQRWGDFPFSVYRANENLAQETCL